jgi:hypothetical protein
MRKRLNMDTRGVLGGCPVKHFAAVDASRPITFWAGGARMMDPKKENPAVGTPGQIFLLSEFTVSVCGLAVVRDARER